MLTLQNDNLTVELSAKGGAITQAKTRDGRHFLRPLEGPFAVGAVSCFPLVPLGNRVGGNAFGSRDRTYRLRPNADDPFYIHGDGWLSDWDVESVDEDRAELLLNVRRSQTGAHQYSSRQRFLLQDNTLRIELDVTNLGPDDMPFGLGLHPFFPNNGAEIQFEAARFWTEGHGSLPKEALAIPRKVDFSEPQTLPDLWLNNAYQDWSGTARIRWPDGLHLEMSADALFNVLMVYAPDQDRSFFCLEPMSHLPNALNMPGAGGMKVLAPGMCLSGGVNFTVAG